MSLSHEKEKREKGEKEKEVLQSFFHKRKNGLDAEKSLKNEKENEPASIFFRKF